MIIRDELSMGTSLFNVLWIPSRFHWFPFQVCRDAAKICVLVCQYDIYNYFIYLFF